MESHLPHNAAFVPERLPHATASCAGHSTFRSRVTAHTQASPRGAGLGAIGETSAPVPGAPRHKILDILQLSWVKEEAGGGADDGIPQDTLNHLGSDATAQQLSRLIQSVYADRPVVGSAFTLEGKKSPTKTR